jgi:hypothetical protein
LIDPGQFDRLSRRTPDFAGVEVGFDLHFHMLGKATFTATYGR